MAFALRLFLLLLLAVALPDRAAQAAPWRAQGADWDGDMGHLEAPGHDGLRPMENAGAKPLGEGDLASQPTSRTEALGDGEGVSAGRTFQAPGLDAARKPSSRRRGPPRGKNKATGHRKPHEPSNTMQQMLKEMLQGGQEMNPKAVLKAAFPGGSSGSWAASAAGREAMPGTAPGDWDRDMEHLKALAHNGLRSMENAGGPPRWKNKEIEDKNSLEASQLLDRMLSDLERRRVLEQMFVQMMAYARGRNGPVPAPVAGKEEMPGPGTGDALGKSSINAENPPSTPRVFCPQDVRKSCMIGTAVTLFTVPLSMVLCYVGFQWWKDKKRHPAAAPAYQPRRCDSPLPPGSPETALFDSSQMWPQMQESTWKAEHQHSMPPPRPPSPAVKRKPPEIPPPPPLPSRPPWSS
ncbi:uncharacterized protein LOC111942338 isoform X3 [Cyanistes caeruleus]|uniref:uncharacterized protein LOC111942338 isoform X3 n=1 Tax=Cyanistes caeruleus TaxID=156563 RepID=UPI000CDB808C|nr:uncharacterized protein LOC111942338 isoform X3 [Cyanistes caeruleus]XP_023801266.1 uncharacterized protein LOC111942338 isoform X3 [Cyanistes caeruleus]